MRRLSLLGAAGVLVVAGACAKDAGSLLEAGRPAGYEATTDYLASAIDDSEGLSHRFEGTMTFDLFGEGADDVPVITGAVDGDRSQMRLDMGAMFESMFGAFGDQLGEEMPDELGGFLEGDLSMEMVVDGDVLYIRAPFFAAMADTMGEEGVDPDDLGPAGEAYDVFTSLGDDWAKVDLSAIEGELPSDVAEQINSGQGMDPSAYLDVVANAESVEDLGGDFVDGVPVTGIKARVDFADMLEAQGTDPETAFEGVDGADEVAELLEDFAFDVEVWIDGDGRVRRLTMDMGAGMEALAEETGEDIPTDAFSISMTFDFFDYGEDVEIEIPADDEVVDITDEWADLAEDLGG